MSFDLSNILNPASAGPSSSQAEDGRRTSLPPLQVPQSPENAFLPREHQSAGGGSSMTREAAHTLAALSASTAPVPDPFNTYSRLPPQPTSRQRNMSYDAHSQAHHVGPTGGVVESGYGSRNLSSPVEQYQPPSRSPEVRRMSTYAEGQTPVEFARPSDSARKMSSPSLEQYQFSSRSPERQRRASAAQEYNPGLTLPPLFSTNLPARSSEQSPAPVQEQGLAQDTTSRPTERMDTKTEARRQSSPFKANFPQILQDLSKRQASEQRVGHDTSHTIDSHATNPDAQREPSYEREGPTTSQIREADVEAQTGDPTQITSENRRGSLAAVKAEPSASFRDSIPAFIPVASLKQEHSTHTQSPLRESSLPVPSTEEMPTPATNTKKRPAPKSASKKGTANAVKKGPPLKKRKLDTDGAKTGKRSSTPSSQKAKTGKALLGKKTTSTSATPLNSSPAPQSARSGSSPARSSREGTYSEDEEEDEDEEDQGTPDPDADVYCICRRPDTGTFMIGCDGGCDDWFHGKCVGIEEKNKNLIDRYICPNCVKIGRGPTTWKRSCRRVSCRMPARVGGKKKGEVPSKYCSEDCGKLYFAERMSAETTPVKKNTRKKSSTGSSFGMDGTTDASDIIIAKGGTVHAGELKSLVTSVSGIDEFKRLGDGVLSPPETPSPTAVKTAGLDQAGLHQETLNEAEQIRTADIVKTKDTARARHALLKDRIKFITMLKQAAVRLAEENNMKPKEMCGYDPRIAWTEDRFAQWRASKAGTEALKTGAFNTNGGTDAIGDMDIATSIANGGEDALAGPCTKRKCARHYDWAKLALDETRFEIGENSEVMRSLEREEREIRERVGLRAREFKAGGVSGTVELHGSEDVVTNGHEGHEDHDGILALGEEMNVDTKVVKSTDGATYTVMPDVEQQAVLTEAGETAMDEGHLTLESAQMDGAAT